MDWHKIKMLRNKYGSKGFVESQHPRGQPSNAGQFAPVPAAPRPSNSSPSNRTPTNRPPSDQSQTLARIDRQARERDLNDPMGSSKGVNLRQRGIDPGVASQFDAHGVDSLKALTQLLNGGIDTAREFYSSPLSEAGKQGYGVTVRDSSSFVVLSHPGETLKKRGIGGVLVDDLYAPNIEDLKKAFPQVKFVAAKDAAKLLPKVAPPGGKKVSY